MSAQMPGTIARRSATAWRWLLVGVCLIDLGCWSAEAPAPGTQSPAVEKSSGLETPASPIDAPSNSAVVADLPVVPNNAVEAPPEAFSPGSSANTPTDTPLPLPGEPWEQAVAAAGLTDYPRERAILLLNGGPLVVDVIPIIDGAPHVAAFDRVIDELLRAADQDGDGRTTWEEVFDNPRVKHGQYGSVAIETERNRRDALQAYDLDHDGEVDRDEVPRFVTRNAGGARAFSIRGAAIELVADLQSPTADVLDADGSGALEPDEIATAGDRLRRRDRNEDDYVTGGDLQAPVENDSANPNDSARPERRGRRVTGPPMARALHEQTPWDALHADLEERYALRGKLHPESFPATPKLFAHLDSNSDGKLRRGEIERLATVPPHAILVVRFGSTSEHEGVTPTVQTLWIEPTLIAPLDTAIESATLRSHTTLNLIIGKVEVVAKDMVGGDFAAMAIAQLNQYDADKNGYLEASEYASQAPAEIRRFEAIDENEDAKAYPDEIERYLRRRQGGQQAQVHARAARRDDPLLAWLDADRDERLSHQELATATERLKLLDRDGDGVVSRDEWPDDVSLVFARGDLENPTLLFAPPTTVVSMTPADQPRWFTRMDTNRDGVINRREFLGPTARFEALDRDHDGALSLAETMATTPQTTDAGDRSNP